MPTTGRIGAAPIPVTSCEGFALRVACDAETDMALLQPCEVTR